MIAIGSPGMSSVILPRMRWRAVFGTRGLEDVVVRCPGCGSTRSIRIAGVDRDGTVVGGLDCTTAGCSLGARADLPAPTAYLDGWRHGAVRIVEEAP